MPPAACQVEPAVSSRRSRRIDVRPAGLREVVQDAGADDASTDDDDLGRRLHADPPCALDPASRSLRDEPLRGGRGSRYSPAMDPAGIDPRARARARAARCRRAAGRLRRRARRRLRRGRAERPGLDAGRDADGASRISGRTRRSSCRSSRSTSWRRRSGSPGSTPDRRRPAPPQLDLDPLGRPLPDALPPGHARPDRAG